jgi:ribosomal-protein-alanine N-acetyltransferase
VSADPQDALALGAIGFASWEESAFGADDAGRADRTSLRSEFVNFCETQADKLVVAKDLRGNLLGWGAREHGDHNISDLWVAPHAQGRGVGAVLLGVLEAAIASSGFAFSELETYAGNVGAVRFYERWGYQPVWRGSKYSASLKYELDKIRFRKSLAVVE